MAACVRDKGNIRNVCQLCGQVNNLMICAGCKRTWYCSREHQKYDWKYHKKKCKKLEQPTNEKQELGQKTKSSINSNEISIPEGSPHVDGLRDSEDVSSTVVDNNKTMSEVRSSNSVGNVSRLEQLNLEEDKQVTVPKIGKNSSKEYFLHSNISELKPFTSESVRQNIARHSSKKRKSSDKMPPTTEEEFDTSKTYFSVLETRTKMLADYACNCLNRYGVCVIDNFLGNGKGLEILEQVQDMHRAGLFTEGQLMNSERGSSNLKHVRGDVLTWVDGGEEGCEDIGFLVSSMDAVILKCAGKLTNVNVNGRTKAMVACYPGNGTQYLRHVDNPNDDGRCITCIYYLNKNWEAKKYGGLLRIYPEGQDRVASIEPVFDRLLFFWSDRRNPHEVMKAFKTRYAITVWYYDADQREKAIKGYKGNMKPEIVPLHSHDQRSVNCDA